MSLEDRKAWLEAHQGLPGKYSDNAAVPARGTRYGELVHASLQGGKLFPIADEGSYFLATNPTPGTGVAGHAAPTDITVDTKPLVLLRNTHTGDASDDVRIYPDFIRLQVTAAGDGGNCSWCLKTDTGTSRYSSGSTSRTPVNTSMRSSRTSTSSLYVGATTATAASASQRLLGSGVVRTVTPVVGDTYLFVFGDDKKLLSNMIVGGSAVANIVIPLPAVVLGATDQLLLHLAGSTQSSASSFEFSIGWIER